jgi:GNAT superfamily N-acetyltransferase
MEIAPLCAQDYSQWEPLARGYKTFYNTPTSSGEFASAWEKLIAQDGVFGLGARIDGELVGIAHYLYHPSTWASKVCYLQDLFTSPSSRGRGVASALIRAVATEALAQGAARFYWLTQEHNLVARALYDKVAAYNGFIRYDAPLTKTGG